MFFVDHELIATLLRLPLFTVCLIAAVLSACLLCALVEEQVNPNHTAHMALNPN